jgi:hypothetical protein
MSKRDSAALERAFEAASASPLRNKLNLQMQMATKIYEQLKRIEKLKHEVMNLDQKTIAELKSYAQPPDAVHQVMAATFLLLGSPERSLMVRQGITMITARLTCNFSINYSNGNKL